MRQGAAPPPTPPKVFQVLMFRQKPANIWARAPSFQAATFFFFYAPPPPPSYVVLFSPEFRESEPHENFPFHFVCNENMFKPLLNAPPLNYSLFLHLLYQKKSIII